MGREDRERDASHADREVDWFFENASPNPDRVGCLSGQTLAELAQRARPITDPGYEHLAHCSPCYQQFRRLQGQTPTAQKAQASKGLLAVAAGIVLIIAAVTATWWLGRVNPSTQRTEVAVLDLRTYLVTRGAQSPERTPIRLSRAEVRVDILLPVGFDPGRYDLRLVDGALVTVLAIQADAAFENQIVTIHTPMKLRDLHSGPYQLALRRVGEDWNFFPTTLE